VTVPKKVRHIPPQSQPEGEVDLAFCPECVTIATVDTMDPVKPCTSCGEKVHKNIIGTWEDVNAGIFQWFHKPEGWWRVTAASKASLQLAYELHLRRKSFEKTAEHLRLTNDFYDLDFTKTLGGRK
jgi:hypothetical protein